MNWLLNCAKPFVISLTLIFAFIKIAENSGTLEVEIDNYQELNDTSVKCIKLCVTTPVAPNNCALNTTTGNSEAKPGNVGDRVYTHPWRYKYRFTNWMDNSKINATVWKQPEDKNCDNSYPTNKTLRSTGQHIIPSMKKPKKYMIVEDAQKWKLLVRTEIKCDDRNCLSPCMPRDDKTGHYTCIDGNKKCLENWFRTIQNCIKFCNKSSTTYNCTQQGQKICLTNWRGENCSTYCNESVTTYHCSQEGQKICLTNWHGENCSTYCNESATTYHCSQEGQKICLTNWHGENCSTYCNESAITYNCNQEGQKICSTNLHGEHCSTKYELEVKVNMTYTDEFKDRESVPFKKLNREMKQTVDDAHKNNSDYEYCNITDVRKGSVIVDITLIFRKPVPSELVRTDAARIGKIGYIKVNLASIRPVNEPSTSSIQTTTEEPDQEWKRNLAIGLPTGMVLLLLTVGIIYKARKNRSQQADHQTTNNQVAVYSKSEVEKSSREATPRYQHINLGSKEDDGAVVKIK